MCSAGQIRRRSLKPICYIDMTAFLSIQLVLLFMFMIVANDRPDLPSNTTDNPKVLHPIPMRGANREDAIILAVQRNGDVWLGYQRVTSADLPAQIHEALSRGAERKVYINADRYAKYGQVLEVLDAVRAGGVERVGFLVWKRDRPNPAP
jgi:biopolymer transport protein ExbD